MCDALLLSHNSVTYSQSITAILLRLLPTGIIVEESSHPVAARNHPARALVPHGVAQGDDRQTDMMCQIMAHKRWGVLDAISRKGEDTCSHPRTVIASPAYPDRRHNGLCPASCLGVSKSHRAIRGRFARQADIPPPAGAGSIAATATRGSAIDKRKTSPVPFRALKT